MNRKECLSSCRLYGIVDMGYTAEHQILPVTEKLLAGGLRILQLRAKNHNPEHIENMGRQLAPLCRKYGCLFIINDYPEIALNIGADGVHLGQDDGDLASVRGLLGKDAVIDGPRIVLNRPWVHVESRRTISGLGPCSPRVPNREDKPLA